MKRILLINPSYQPHWSRCEPTGLIQLASFIENKGHTVEILDMNIYPISDKKLINLISKFNPTYIGITALTCQADKAYMIGNLIKTHYPNKIIVYGGVHPTFMPKEPFEKGSANYVILGEGEQTFLNLINNIKIQNINGIGYKENEEIIINSKRNFVDINSLPIPDYSKIEISKYNTEIHDERYNHKKTVHIMTSRGCPNNCIYCASPRLYEQKMRFRSVDKIIEEIKILKDEQGVECIHFHDDNFMLKTDRLKELCEKLKPLNVHWNCLARVDTIVKNPEVLKYMKDYGCVGVEIGVESGDPIVHQKLKKSINFEDIKKAVTLLKENHLTAMYLMMSYAPGETIDSPYLSYNLLLDIENTNDITKVNLMGHHTRASPGCEFYDNVKEKGLYLARSWSDHFEENINFIPNSLLNDVPVRTNNNLNILNDKIRIIEFLSKRIFYSTYQLIIDNFKNLDNFIEFMKEIYKKVDGIKNVKQISERYNIKLIVSALSYLSIFRMVKSK